jgi:hypothetical protein
MKLAHEVLVRYPESRKNKNTLVFLMWRTKHGGSSTQFINDFINGVFKIESYTRAARKVVEVCPELGNPDRKRLENQFKAVVKESSIHPNQLEINFSELT